MTPPKVAVSGGVLEERRDYLAEVGPCHTRRDHRHLIPPRALYCIVGAHHRPFFFPPCLHENSSHRTSTGKPSQ